MNTTQMPYYGMMPMMPMAPVMPSVPTARGSSLYTPAVVDIIIKTAEFEKLTKLSDDDEKANEGKKSSEMKKASTEFEKFTKAVVTTVEGALSAEGVAAGEIIKTGLVSDAGGVTVQVVILPKNEEEKDGKKCTLKPYKVAEALMAKNKEKALQVDGKDVTSIELAVCQNPICAMAKPVEGLKQLLQLKFDELDGVAQKKKAELATKTREYKNALSAAEALQDDCAGYALNQSELESLRTETLRVKGELREIDAALREVKNKLNRSEEKLKEKNSEVVTFAKSRQEARDAFMEEKKEAAKAATELAEAESELAELQEGSECIDCADQAYACSKCNTFTGKYSVVLKHEEQCGAFGCDFGCGYTGSFQAVKAHEAKCTARPMMGGTVMMPNMGQTMMMPNSGFGFR